MELVTNPGIEVDTAGWAPWFSTCTIARSIAQARTGAASLQLTASAANNYIGVNETLLDLVAGAIYTASWWVRVPDAITYTPVIGDAGGDWAVSGAGIAVPANTWTQVTVANFAAGAWGAGDELMCRLNRATGTYSGQVIHWDDFSVIGPDSKSHLLTLGVG